MEALLFLTVLILFTLLSGYVTAYVLFRLLRPGILRALLIVPVLLFIAIATVWLMMFISGKADYGLFFFFIPGDIIGLIFAIYLLHKWDKRNINKV